MENTNLKIMVIDDLLTMRKILVKMLKQFGFTNIQEANDGAAAWLLIEESIENRQPFQMIISDWNLSKMNGLELLLKIRKDDRTSKLPFLLIITEGEQATVIKEVNLGKCNFIVKPFKSETLKVGIEALISN